MSQFARPCFVLFLLLAGCSVGTNDAPLGGGDRDSGGAAACNALVDDGTRLTEELVASDAPGPGGGAIEDGDYRIKRATLYTGPGGTTTPTGNTVAVALRVAGSSFQLVTDGERRSATASANGTLLSTTTTCPAGKALGKVETTGYTASAGSLELHVPRSPGTLVLTFVRR